MNESWAYRCSRCGELVEVDDVTAHLAAHRAEPGWDGLLGLTREDRGDDDEGQAA